MDEPEHLEWGERYGDVVHQKQQLLEEVINLEKEAVMITLVLTLNPN